MIKMIKMTTFSLLFSCAHSTSEPEHSSQEYGDGTSLIQSDEGAFCDEGILRSGDGATLKTVCSPKK